MSCVCRVLKHIYIYDSCDCQPFPLAQAASQPGAPELSTRLGSSLDWVSLLGRTALMQEPDDMRLYVGLRLHNGFRTQGMLNPRLHT